MVSLTSRLPAKQIFSLQSPDMVSFHHLLFVCRAEQEDLVTHCLEEGIPFTLFKSWESIFETTKDIV